MMRVGLYILLAFLIVKKTHANSNSQCFTYPTGTLQISDGTVLSELNSVFTVKPQNKNSVARLRDLKSGKIINWDLNLSRLPLARTESFSKILLVSSDLRNTHFYVINSRGDTESDFDLPSRIEYSHSTEESHFQFSEDSEHIYFSSESLIADYDLIKQKWTILYDTKSAELKLGWWLPAPKKWVFALFLKNKVIYKVPSVQKKSSALEGELFIVKNIETKGVDFEYHTLSNSSFLVSKNTLLFDESTQLKLWNTETGSIISIDLGLENSSGPRKFIKSFDEKTFGIAYLKKGEFVFYNLDGSYHHKVTLEPMETLNQVNGRNEVFFKLTKNSRFQLIDLNTNKIMPWPSLFGFVTDENLESINGNHWIVNIPNSSGEDLKVIEFESIKSCFSYEESEKGILSLNNNKLNLSFFLSLENQIEGLRRENVLEFVKKEAPIGKHHEVFLDLLLHMGMKTQIDIVNWSWYLNYFSSTLFTLSSSMKEVYLDTMGISMADQARRNSPDYFELKKVSNSKIVNVIIEALKPYFGIPSEGKSDFTFVRKGTSVQSNQVIPLVLGSYPIDQNEKTQIIFGLYEKILPAIEITGSQLLDYKYDWNMNHHQWVTQGKIQLTSLEHLINTSESINYPKLWKDGVLTGAVVISSNLMDGFENLAYKIVEYYEDQGFSFGLPQVKTRDQSGSFWNSLTSLYMMPRSIENIGNSKQWLKSMIETGKIDYLVKEAHSGGGDEVLWLAKNNFILKGTKKINQTQSEEIYILYPQSIDPLMKGKEVSLTDQDFFEWLNMRNQNRGGDLIYVNASCWSSYRAKQELIVAKNPLLQEIVTDKSSFTFANKPNNHEKMVIDMIRQGASYSDMHRQLSEIKDSPNPYVFPNEETYKKLIWNDLYLAIDYSGKILKY